MSTKTIDLALIGAGPWARATHLPALALVSRGAVSSHLPQGVQLRVRAIADIDGAAVESAGARYDISVRTTDLSAVRRIPEIDAFAVVVSPRVMPRIVSDLVPLGKPILAEKPPGADFRTAAALAESVSVPHVVAFNRRFMPLHERFREIVRQTDGIYFVDAFMLRHERTDSLLPPPRMPFVVGTAIHTINLLEYLFGPIATCRAAALPRSETVHGWTADIDFEVGIRGRLAILPTCGAKAETLTAHSRHRSLSLLTPTGPGDAGRIEVWENGVLSRKIDGDSTAEDLLNRGFVGEYLELMSLVCAGGVSRSTFSDAANSMRVAEKIEGAGRSGDPHRAEAASDSMTEQR